MLTPYDDEHDNLYTSTIEPAVARHMILIRLDRLPKSEAIYTSFADAIQSASAVIADITTLNENVMYEIGYSHGRGLIPLIYTRDADRLTQLPVYFRTFERTIGVCYYASHHPHRGLPTFLENKPETTSAFHLSRILL